MYLFHDFDIIIITPPTHHCVSSHRRFKRLFSIIFWLKTKKTPTLYITGLCQRNLPVTDGFPPPGILWRHYVEIRHVPIANSRVFSNWFVLITFVIDSLISTNWFINQLAKYCCSYDINLNSVKPSTKLWLLNLHWSWLHRMIYATLNRIQAYSSYEIILDMRYPIQLLYGLMDGQSNSWWTFYINNMEGNGRFCNENDPSGSVLKRQWLVFITVELIWPWPFLTP